MEQNINTYEIHIYEVDESTEEAVAGSFSKFEGETVSEAAAQAKRLIRKYIKEDPLREGFHYDFSVRRIRP